MTRNMPNLRTDGAPGAGTSADAEPRPIPATPRRLSAAWLLDGPGFGWLRFAVDFAMLWLSVAAALVGAKAAGVVIEARWALFLFPFVAVTLLFLRGMYRTRLRTVILDGIAPVVGAISVAAIAMVAVIAFTDDTARPAPLVARAWVFALIYVGAGRVLLALSQRRARERGVLFRSVLIVGAGIVGAHVARRLEEEPEYGLKPIGFLDADPPPGVEVADRRAPVLGSPDDLERVAAETGASYVILAFSSEPDAGLVPIVRRCEELGLDVALVPRLFDSINERMRLEHLGGLPLLGLRQVDPKGWQFTIKHTLDRVLSGLGLVVLAPLFGILALLIKQSSPGPVMFRQTRVGRDGKVFDLLKFRSMRPPRPEDEDFAPEAGAAPGGVEGVDRRTTIGKFLRKSSLDELPQLINVLRGEMSLVGPRPERPEFVRMFRQDIARYTDRHRVKSGITGWAQVHGYRGQTSLADRVEWDNFYIENWSLWLDFKILLLTVVAVFSTAEDD